MASLNPTLFQTRPTLRLMAAVVYHFVNRDLENNARFLAESYHKLRRALSSTLPSNCFCQGSFPSGVDALDAVGVFCCADKPQPQTQTASFSLESQRWHPTLLFLSYPLRPNSLPFATSYRQRVGNHYCALVPTQSPYLTMRRARSRGRLPSGEPRYCRCLGKAGPVAQTYLQQPYCLPRQG